MPLSRSPPTTNPKTKHRFNTLFSLLISFFLSICFTSSTIILLFFFFFFFFFNFSRKFLMLLLYPIAPTFTTPQKRNKTKNHSRCSLFLRAFGLTTPDSFFFLVHLDAGLLFILTFVVIAVFCFSNDWSYCETFNFGSAKNNKRLNTHPFPWLSIAAQNVLNSDPSFIKTPTFAKESKRFFSFFFFLSFLLPLFPLCSRVWNL